MQDLVSCADASKLVVYPQLLLATLAMMHTSVVHVCAHALCLLRALLQRLDLSNPTTQNILLAALPVRDGDDSAFGDENAGAGALAQS